MLVGQFQAEGIDRIAVKVCYFLARILTLTFEFDVLLEVSERRDLPLFLSQRAS